MSIDAVFAQFFDNIHDPRQHAKIYYPFYDVLFLTVCAVIGGAEGWEDIEDFGEVHLPWFQSKGLFKNGIPVHDTIARIISGIKPEPFQAAFVRWTQAINQHTDGALVAIDGKTLRSSYDREDRTSTIHMVSAYAAANKLVLGQIKTDAKSNEITAIPELLALLDIKGCLVSIDAMGCQTEIAETILQQGGDYLLAVKGNQPKLFEAVRQALAPLAATAAPTLFKQIPLPGAPFDGIAVTPDGARLYVSLVKAKNPGVNTIAVVDTASATVVDEIVLGDQGADNSSPRQLYMAPDGKMVVRGVEGIGILAKSVYFC